MYRLIRRQGVEQGCIILDLEDAFWDANDARKTSARRAEARHNLGQFCERYSDLFTRQRIGIRINAPGTEDIREDLRFLKTLRSKVQFDCLCLPKVEMVDTARESLSSTMEIMGDPTRVLPFIETPTAIENLTSLLRIIHSSGVHRVVYGHYDYSLNAGHWPFLETDELGYWQLVTPIIQQIESAGLHYVSPPIFDLQDTQQLRSFLAKLDQICKRPFTIFSLSVEHTAVFEQLNQVHPNKEATEPSLINRSLSQAQRALYAQEVCNAYQAHRANGKSFAVNMKGGEFISPHKYLAARNYLEQIRQ
ncbi:aldolase/citrate lyase family protein [Coraliomargarita akajimensis]|nr:aldolase/citrate lyase family protein [Coraliomargarita akajimensis]